MDYVATVVLDDGTERTRAGTLAECVDWAEGVLKEFGAMAVMVRQTGGKGERNAEASALDRRQAADQEA